MFIDHKSLSLAFDHATSSKTSSSITSFIDEEIEASENQVTCPKLPSTLEKVSGFQLWGLTLSTPPSNSLLPPWCLKTLLREGVRPTGTHQREDWQQKQALPEPGELLQSAGKLRLGADTCTVFCSTASPKMLGQSRLNSQPTEKLKTDSDYAVLLLGAFLN